MSEAYQKFLSGHSPGRIPGTLVRTIDMHTGGEPLRIVMEGMPEVSASNVLEYRRKLRDEHDHIRRSLIFEPRGHADMYGVYIVPPNDEQADFGAVFFHNEGYSTMCGHAIIAMAKLAVESGWVKGQPEETPVVIDAPCGRIFARVIMTNDKPGKVYFEGVPSFVVGDGQVEVNGQEVRYTLAYGGAFYAYVDAPTHSIDLNANITDIIKLGMAVKHQVASSNSRITHPFEDDLSFLYGTIFTGGESQKGLDKNICIFADGEVDRSPTGSGVSGRLAIHHLRGDIETGEEVLIESVSGSVFSGRVLRETEFGPHKAVIPEVGGEAFITGKHEFIMDDSDPFKEGFLLD